MTINYFSITDFRFSVMGYFWWYTVHFYYHPLIKKRKHMSHSNPVFAPWKYKVFPAAEDLRLTEFSEDEDVETSWG